MSAPTHTPALSLTGDGIDTAKQILVGLANQRRTLQLAQEYGVDTIDSNAIGVAQCNRVEKLWRSQGRQVLAMHPELTAEVRMATSAKIEPEVFRTLPYREPLVVFPGGIEIPSWKDHEQMRCLGFFTHGRIDRSDRFDVRPGATLDEVFDEAVTITSTHDPDSQAFSVIIVNLVTGQRDPILEYNRVTFPLSGPITLKEIIDQKVANYGWDDKRVNDWRDGDTIAQQAFMRSQLAAMLGTVMYLCSTVLDAESVPVSRIKRAWGDTTRKPPNLINVGWRIGPALSAARAESRTKQASDQPGRTLPPHQRRAHFKTVWTGRGRTVPKTVFIAPYWVHKDQMHLVDTKTVRAVR